MTTVFELNINRCHGMDRSQVADGGDGLEIWRVTTNVLNIQSWTADKRWSCSLDVGCKAYNRSPQKPKTLLIVTKGGAYTDSLARFEWYRTLSNGAPLWKQ